MPALLLSGFIALSIASVQVPPSPAVTDRAAELRQALVGHWTGVLEYRDYSEPETSTRRVQLPTWLTVQPAAEGLAVDYVYDDGPGKTVTSHATLLLDMAAARYRLVATDATTEDYRIQGLETLKQGRGTLTLTGSGTDNGKPAEIHTTWLVGRNLLSWLEEVRPAGSSAPFVFRHRYTLTRADAPAPQSSPVQK